MTFVTNWMTVLMSIDVFLATNYTLKYHLLSTKRRWILATIAIFLYGAVYETTWALLGFEVKALYHDHDDMYPMEYIRPQSEWGEKYNKIDAYIKVVTHVLLPTLVMAVFVFFTTRALLRQQKEAVSTASTTNKGNRNKRDQNIIQMALICIIINFFCTIPMTIMHLISSTHDGYWDQTDWPLPWCMEVTRDITSLIQHISNPIVYFIVRKNFRDQAINLLMCRSRQRRPNSTMSSVSFANNSSRM